MSQNDSTKYYQPFRKVNSRKPKKPLAIYDEQLRLVTSEGEQVELITKYFKELFSSNDTPDAVEPAMMTPPFTPDEIERAAKKLNNNKVTDRDDVHAEFIKYGTNKLYVQMATLLNKTSETGEYPEEIKHGILTPLVKPPKKDERINVRPIILLSVLRGVVTINLIERCWDRLKTHIPPSQAASRSGCSTT